MAADDLIARLRKAREFEVSLTDGAGVTLRRPAAGEVAKLRGGVSAYLDCAVAWSKVSERLLAGEGSDKALPFDADLWREAAMDRGEWINAVIEAMAANINAHAEAIEATRKN